MDGLTEIPESCGTCPEAICLVGYSDYTCDYPSKVYGYGLHRSTHIPRGCTAPPPDWCPRRTRRALDLKLSGRKEPKMTKKKEKKIVLRPSVQWFAEQMELRLRRHDDERGERGWSDDDPEDLYLRLREESSELEDALSEFDVFDDMLQAIKKFNLMIVGGLDSVEGNKLAVVGEAIHEAADVANFAMMIADVLWERHTQETDE